jgi:parallel beta-helix repeat protein
MLRLPVIIFITLLIWITPIDAGRTYIVDDDDFANYRTIQEAVVAANDGDTIYIKPGTYTEEILLNKSLSLMPLTGENGPIVIRGDGKETGITISADGCSLESLTLQNFTGPGISIMSNGNIIKDNHFEKDNPAILVINSHMNTITKNTIQDCQGGVALKSNSSDNNVQENKIDGGDVSIFLWEVGKNLIVKNQATGSTWGIWLKDAKDIDIEANDIKSKTYGIWLLNSSTTSIAKNNVSIEKGGTINTIGIFLANTSEIDVLGNKISGGTFGLGVSDSDSNKLTDNLMASGTQGIYVINSSSQEFNKNSIKNVEYGITLENSSKNSIKECSIENSTVGLGLGKSTQNDAIENSIVNTKDTAIQMGFSSSNNLSGNQIKNSYRGIIISESPGNLLQNNRLQDVNWSLYVEGIDQNGFDNSIDETNLADGKPIVYLYDQSQASIQNKELAHLTLAYCHNITIKNTAITNDAVFLFNSSNNQILENNISNCFGMRLVNSVGNEVSRNRLSGNIFSGLFLVSSDSNQIEENIASENNQNGISLIDCRNNILRGNLLDRNHQTGIWLNLSNDNRIYQNNISNNLLGLQVLYSSGNQIYHNNFINNKDHSQDLEGRNSWDMGNITGGNYWSGHVAKGNPSQNWPRMIKGGKMDLYPFQDVSGWEAAKPAPLP